VKQTVISSRDRRVLLLGAGVVLFTWLATRAIPAALSWHASLRDRAEASALQLTRSREALAQETLIRESLAVRAARLVSMAPRLLAGRTEAEAVAEFSGLVNGLATRHRVRLVQLQPIPDSTRGLFTAISLRLELQGDVAGLAGWLAALEEGERLLAVREIQITATNPAAPPSQPETLRAELVVRGWAALGTPGSD
jgi:hypothetical protein